MFLNRCESLTRYQVAVCGDPPLKQLLRAIVRFFDECSAHERGLSSYEPILECASSADAAARATRPFASGSIAQPFWYDVALASYLRSVGAFRFGQLASFGSSSPHHVGSPLASGHCHHF